MLACCIVAIFNLVYLFYTCDMISIVIIYRMDLNFRGTKLSRIENFRVFRVFILADARPTILY